MWVGKKKKAAFVAVVVIVFVSGGALFGTAMAAGLPSVPPLGFLGAGEQGTSAGRAALGVATGGTIVPVEFAWDVMEPRPGRFVWADADAVVARWAGQARLVGVLRYPNDLPLPLETASRPGWPSAHRDDWVYFVNMIVGRYGDVISDWVVEGGGDERDLLQVAVAAQNYARFVQLTATAVHRHGDQNVYVAVPGADVLWQQVFAAAGGTAAVDGLAVDVNRWPVAPEGMETVFADVRELSAAAGFAPELWLWRFGYPTHTDVSVRPPHRPGVTETEQAAFLLRAYVLAAASGADAVVFSDLIDKGSGADVAADNFGLYDANVVAKPAARVVSEFARRVAGARYVPPTQWPELVPSDDEPSVDEPADAESSADAPSPAPDVGFIFSAADVSAQAGPRTVELHRFRGDDGDFFVLWIGRARNVAPESAEVLDEHLDALDGVQLQMYDMFGDKLDELVVGEAPVYVYPSAPDAEFCLP